MTTSKAPPDESEEDSGELASSWARFLASVPIESRVTTTLRRYPCKYTPDVTEEETLPGPAFSESLEAMQVEVRRMAGPGKYLLMVRSDGAGDKKKIRLQKVWFTLPPLDREEPARYAEAPNPADEADAAVDDTLARLARAANVQSRARELTALSAAVGGGAAAPAGSVSDTLQLVKALREIMPAPASLNDTLTMLKTAREVFAPAADGSGALDGIAKVLDIAQKLNTGGAPGAARDRWADILDVVLSHGATFIQALGPMLPAIVQAAKGGGVPAGPAATNPPTVPAAPAVAGALGEPADPAGPSVETLLPHVDGDPERAARLRAFLDLVVLEASLPPAQWEDGHGRAAEFADVHLPGFGNNLLTLDPSALAALWGTLDPRTARVPILLPWVEGFVAYLKLPVDEGAAAPGAVTP